MRRKSSVHLPPQRHTSVTAENPIYGTIQEDTPHYESLTPLQSTRRPSQTTTQAHIYQHLLNSNRDYNQDDIPQIFLERSRLYLIMVLVAAVFVLSVTCITLAIMLGLVNNPRIVSKPSANVPSPTVESITTVIPCVDRLETHKELCDSYVNAGYCEKHPDLMRRDCKRSCRLYDVEQP